MQRCGQLLKEFQTGPDGGRPSKNGGGTPTVSQRQAADEAGMSKDQEVQAVRVANVPDVEFEEAVEAAYVEILDLLKPLNCTVRSRVVKILAARFE